MARWLQYEHFVRMDIFASKLKDRAAELGISNAEAARRSGLSERCYAHYASGAREPDLATLVRIAQSLGTTPDVLLGVSEAKHGDMRHAMIDRVSTTMVSLPDDILEIIVIQIEALGLAKGNAG